MLFSLRNITSSHLPAILSSYEPSHPRSPHPALSLNQRCRTSGSGAISGPLGFPKTPHPLLPGPTPYPPTTDCMVVSYSPGLTFKQYKHVLKTPREVGGTTEYQYHSCSHLILRNSRLKIIFNKFLHLHFPPYNSFILKMHKTVMKICIFFCFK